MFQVTSSLPNMSANINGVAFMKADGGGVVTVEPVTAEEAAMFSEIPGFTVVDLDPPKVAAVPAEKNKGGRPSKADLAARAAAEKEAADKVEADRLAAAGAGGETPAADAAPNTPEETPAT